ncbi:ubiquitin carboxyl-terminal hydrolase 7 [Mytilus galloprovincialis]|uniref:Ubiquitin carboxyl-terminal hydrolase 7 n=1 Tax=Mytilus galloprovincialis TaxID=29158 RepID=A0A8B6HSN7_MYTGA|nr:ubiquitin carboxyl-terminal hydrolase 7 [Mytilus galloprovincialis]
MKLSFVVEISKKIQGKLDALNQGHEQDLDSPIGLSNPSGKNLCFANSILQCLRVVNVDIVLANHSKCEDMHCFICTLTKFYTDKLTSAEPLCQLLTAFWENYYVGLQQDSHELLLIILDKLYENMDRGSRRQFNDVQRWFFGVRLSSVQCNQCGLVSKTKEKFGDLNLSLHKAKSVDQSMQNYFQGEEVDFECRKFNGNRKDLSNIEVPLNLNITPYLENKKDTETDYTLAGVLVHQGRSVNSGHYYAFVIKNGRWYRVDDSRTMGSANQLKNINDGKIVPKESPNPKREI